MMARRRCRGELLRTRDGRSEIAFRGAVQPPRRSVRLSVGQGRAGGDGATPRPFSRALEFWKLVLVALVVLLHEAVEALGVVAR